MQMYISFVDHSPKRGQKSIPFPLSHTQPALSRLPLQTHRVYTDTVISVSNFLQPTWSESQIACHFTGGTRKTKLLPQLAAAFPPALRHRALSANRHHCHYRQQQQLQQQFFIGVKRHFQHNEAVSGF